MKPIDIGLIILTSIALILLIIIIFNSPRSTNMPENFSQENNQEIHNNTPIIDEPIHVQPESNTGKFTSIPSGLKIDMEDIINMTPVKQNKYLEDSLFANVITYTNDDVDNEHMTFANLGIGKCLKNPNCESCVEFGVTGTAMCFPKE